MIKSLSSGLTVYQSKQKISNLFSVAWFDEEIFCSIFQFSEIYKTRWKHKGRYKRKIVEDMLLHPHSFSQVIVFFIQSESSEVV